MNSPASKRPGLDVEQGHLLDALELEPRCSPIIAVNFAAHSGDPGVACDIKAQGRGARRSVGTRGLRSGRASDDRREGQNSPDESKSGTEPGRLHGLDLRFQIRRNTLRRYIQKRINQSTSKTAAPCKTGS